MNQPRDRLVKQYVGLEADLREYSILLLVSRGDMSGRVNVPEPLVLADDLLRRWIAVLSGRIGCAAEATRLSRHGSPRQSASGPLTRFNCR